MHQAPTYRLIFQVLFFLWGLPILSQEPGPVISGFGAVYRIEKPDIPRDTTLDLWAVFDLSESPTSRNIRNPRIETAARFLNLHVGHGFPKEKLKIALVVHGNATEDLLRPEVYSEKHGQGNPNAALIRELLDAGVEIAICGQSAQSRNINRKETITGVQWALSAMTALIYYQNKGYQFIKF